MLHNLIVLSSEAEHIIFPQGEKDNDLIIFSCPSKIEMHFLYATSQRYIKFIFEEAINLPFGLNFTA